MLAVVQMANGTAEIQAALGPQSSKVTVQQIQEALWHYYYDVDKSVAFLISKFIDPPAPKKKETPGRCLTYTSFACRIPFQTNRLQTSDPVVA